VSARDALDALADALTLTEERTSELDLGTRRLVVNHSLTVHRDKDSADDIRAMLDHLTAAGMPGHATVKVDGGQNHTRIWATWHTDPADPR
jgi:hypothetical protein